MKNNFDMLLEKLGSEVSDGIKQRFSYDEIREIRISANHPIKIVTADKKYPVGRKISAMDIRDIFASLCEYSVHAYKDEICSGFITICGGYRTGICGTAVYENGKIINIKDISALNIRIPHEIKNAGDKLLNLRKKGGILLIGPPCSGKTTVLRDFARQESRDSFVTIVDERMEIGGIFRGVPAFDIGESTVLNGFSKSDGIQIAARTMAPDYIICDEFGDENDISSAFYAMKSGTEIVASMHAFDRNDFLSKPFADKIIKSGIFGYFAFLNKNCEIYEIIKTGDMS